MRSGRALLAAAAAVVALCAGCAPGTATPTGTDAGRLGTELDQLQSTLDSVSAQVGADSTP